MSMRSAIDIRRKRSKRSRLELCIAVLQAAASGKQLFTPIMYGCNLSWNPLQEILAFLIDHGFLVKRVVGRRKLYEITEKGLQVLEHYNVIQGAFFERERER